MDISAILLLTALIFAAAALSLNILAARIATVTYLRAGRFSWQLFWPLALASVPFAYVGGTPLLKRLLALVIAGVKLMAAVSEDGTCCVR